MALLLLATHGWAQDVEVASLGELALRYQKAESVDVFPGRQLAAQVGFRQGEAFTLVAPGRIQQIEYLVEIGTKVRRGEAFARLRGPEVHHFLVEFEASKQILAAAERRFQSNRALYERKAIRESQWMEVSEKYYAAQLEYEHLRHFNDLVLLADEEADVMTIAAPVDGIVDYFPTAGAIGAGETIAVFVPEQAVRLQVAIPISTGSELTQLRTPDCELEVESISGISRGFFRPAWSEPIGQQCGLMLGQQLLVTPMFRGEAFSVRQSAVFQWRGATSILVRSGQSLSVREVELLGSSGADYILRSDQSLRGTEILVSSVSAVQGKLLGLGGE